MLRSHIETLQFDNFDPELLLSPLELKQANAYLKQSSRYTSHVWDLKYLEKYRESNQRISAKMQSLASAALLRQSGLEKFMVVSIHRYDRLIVKLQVLEVNLIESGFRTAGGQKLLWSIRGRTVRKDGSLGKKDDRIGFDKAFILRRRLDNTWVPIKPSLYANAT